MKKKNSVGMYVLLAVVGMLAVGYPLAPQEGEEPKWQKMANALAQKLATFVPQPVAGLLDRIFVFEFQS